MLSSYGVADRQRLDNEGKPNAAPARRRDNYPEFDFRQHHGNSEHMQFELSAI